jgi:hypothetical protein
MTTAPGVLPGKPRNVQPQGAQISYLPSLSQYRERTTRRLKINDLPLQVPQGWPTKVDYPMAWVDGSFKSQSFIWQLAQETIDEIGAALQYFKGNSRPGGDRPEEL